ncbi:hypothetical protein SNE40_022360 [Patella caerulea]|uniref:EGF-like domain-containing protein n=1 Tax=Patella caerulea TaxID=87958 RepID=A0AAN8FWI0_PATCE
MRVILWIAMFLTTVVAVSGKRSTGPLSQVRGIRNPRCISCSEVKEAHLCESCCKRPVCDPNPCKNDGMCSPDDNGYSCSCTPGYLGEHCDVNLCLPNPCKNNGTCSPVDNGYVCNCATGYLGEHCDVNPCDIYNPCINNGTCYPSGLGVNCSCPSGFTGDYCQDSEGITPVKEVRVCNVTECGATGGTCTNLKCFTNATNCSGKACNSDEICIDDTCVNRIDNCRTIDGVNNDCSDRGDQCGASFCAEGQKCVNDRCRPIRTCAIQNGDCEWVGESGTCSGGVCLIFCEVNNDCRNQPCIDGYCAGAKCGESYCAGSG